MCIFFHPFSVRLTFSPTTSRQLSFLEEGVRGRKVNRAILVAPDIPKLLLPLSPLHFPSFISPHLSVGGILFFYEVPSLFSYKHNHNIHVKSIGDSSGSKYGANRFFASSVELLRQGWQAHLKLSPTAQSNCYFLLHLVRIYQGAAEMSQKQIFQPHFEMKSWSRREKK